MKHWKMVKKKKKIYKRKLPYKNRFPYRFYGMGLNAPADQTFGLRRRICLDQEVTVALGANYYSGYINPDSFSNHEIVTAYDNIFEDSAIVWFKITFHAYANNLDPIIGGSNTVQDVILWTEADTAASSAAGNVERMLAIGERFFYPFQNCSRSCYVQKFLSNTGSTIWTKSSDDFPVDPGIFFYIQTTGAVAANTVVGKIQSEAIVAYRSAKF